MICLEIMSSNKPQVFGASLTHPTHNCIGSLYIERYLQYLLPLVTICQSEQICIIKKNSNSYIVLEPWDLFLCENSIRLFMFFYAANKTLFDIIDLLMRLAHVNFIEAPCIPFFSSLKIESFHVGPAQFTSSYILKMNETTI